MNGTKKLLIAGCVAVILAGCSSTQPLYYWGNYSNTAYDYQQQPSDKTFKRHRQTLRDIVYVAENKGKQVPPGIYAELGQMEMQSGNVRAARSYFLKEQSTYPESTQLMTLVLTQLDKQEAANDN